MRNLKLIEYIDYVKSFAIANNIDLGSETYETNDGVEVPYFRSHIYHHEDPPLDSYDRIYALYLIDVYPEIVANFDVNTVTQFESHDEAVVYLENLMGPELWEAFISLPTNLAYENYEREGMSPTDGLANLLNIARQGRDATLTDSYANGGWFGAS